MSKELIQRGLSKSRQTEETCVVTEAPGGLSFGNGLFGGTGKARDAHQRSIGPLGGAFRKRFENRLIEPDVADLELGGVHSDRKPPSARVDIVARERSLPVRVELTLSIQCQRVRRNSAACADCCHYL